MSHCPTIHEHPEFQKYYKPNDKQQEYQYNKTKRFLHSSTGHQVGEYLKHDLVPFKSFPRKGVDVRCLFVLCKNCKGEALKNCNFCSQKGHTIDDAVLFFIGNHEKAYETTGRKIIEEYKK